MAPRPLFVVPLLLIGCVDPMVDTEVPPPAAAHAPALPPPAPSAPLPPAPRCALSSSHLQASQAAEAEDAPPTVDHDDRDGHVDGPGVCPEEMALIHGDYCLTAAQECVEWMDTEIPLSARKRCARFAPSKCLGEHRHLRFCIDRLEQAKAPDALPINDLSWTMAREQCQAQGKRLCFEQEWTFACEGPHMLPYPYGLERDARRCNHDRTDLLDGKKMKDNRHPADAHPDCMSPFGVQNMVGNVDEWVQFEKGYPPQRSGLKGGWWLAGRNRCRPATGGHDEYYHDTQTGFRCCKEAQLRGACQSSEGLYTAPSLRPPPCLFGSIQVDPTRQAERRGKACTRSSNRAASSIGSPRGRSSGSRS